MQQGSKSKADTIMNDCWDLPRTEEVCFNGLPTWQEDPFDEQYWKMLFYSFRGMLDLTAAYEETSEKKYLEKLKDLINSFPVDEADRKEFKDYHAAAFRVLTMTYFYNIFEQAGVLNDQIDAKIKMIIEHDAEYLMPEEHYESTFNHAFSEAAALIFVSANWPEFKNSDAYFETGMRRINQFMRILLGLTVLSASSLRVITFILTILPGIFFCGRWQTILNWTIFI